MCHLCNPSPPWVVADAAGNDPAEDCLLGDRLASLSFLGCPVPSIFCSSSSLFLPPSPEPADAGVRLAPAQLRPPRSRLFASPSLRPPSRSPTFADAASLRSLSFIEAVILPLFSRWSPRRLEILLRLGAGSRGRFPPRRRRPRSRRRRESPAPPAEARRAVRPAR